jgi:poly(3-hydroxybutyrate) depolymerase
MYRPITLCLGFLLVAAALGGCGDDTSETTSSTTSPPATSTLAPTEAETDETQEGLPESCSEPLAAAGEYEGLNTVGAVEQSYWIVVPDSYADGAPAPLFLQLASGDGSHDTFLAGWRPYLDDLPGLMVMVNTSDPASTTTEVLLALVDQVSGDYCVDPTRIHVMGTAWTGAIAHQLACDGSGRIASFASSPNTSVATDCRPSRPVPLLTLTGDPDREHTTALVDLWVEINGCGDEPLVDDLGSGVHRKTYQNCDADILFYDIEGAPHAFFLHEAKGPAADWVAEYEEVDYLEEAFAFFTEHPMP